MNFSLKIGYVLAMAFVGLLSLGTPGTANAADRVCFTYVSYHNFSTNQWSSWALLSGPEFYCGDSLPANQSSQMWNNCHVGYPSTEPKDICESTTWDYCYRTPSSNCPVTRPIS